MDQPIEQPDEFHGVGGSYIIDPETQQRKPYTGREHLLIKPARPPAPAIPKPESEPKPEKPAQPQPISKKKTKRGAK